MDDYNVSVLSEAKNEYSLRLVSILCPLFIEGVKSIFNEAMSLCEENSEEDKYLMTFQNFLTRVPKWNNTIVNEETERILRKSECPYLEDLLTCVHITQLKILTSIRVSTKQKKLDVDIPKLSEFIHKCYISFARKLYQNVYLFEKQKIPLQYQKNLRETELICKECILEVIRDSMPVDKILRAYIDETVDEEVVEETIEENLTPEEAAKKEEEDAKKAAEKEEEKKKEEEETSVSKVELVPTTSLPDETPKEEEPKEELKINIDTETLSLDDKQPEKTDSILPLDDLVLDMPLDDDIVDNKKGGLSFSDNDKVLDMGTNQESIVNAPKTDERLEEIARVQHEKRKAEEAEEEDDDDDNLKILGDNVKLEISDIHDLSQDKVLKPDPILNDVEVLA